MEGFSPVRGGKKSPSSRFQNQSYQRQQSMPTQKKRHSPKIDAQNAIREVKLITNSYSLVNIGKDIIINEYKLNVTTASGSKNLPDNVLNKHFVSTSIRKLILNDLLPSLLEPKTSINTVIIDSNLNAIYTSKLLIFNNVQEETKSSSSNDLVVKFEKLLVKTDLLNYLYIDVAIKYSRSFSLSSEDSHVDLLSSVLHHQLSVQMFRFGSVFYETNLGDQYRERRLDLISQHTMGISISRLRQKGGHFYFVLNCTNSYITEPFRIIDLLTSFIIGEPVEGSNSAKKEILSIKGNEDWFLSFCAILSGFKCQASCPKGSVNLRFSQTEEPSNILKIDSEEDGEKRKSVTVQEYYQHIGINLEYPNLPCLKSKSTSPSHYPLELCSLLPGQKVPIFRLSQKARTHLAMLNKPRAHACKQTISQARNKLEEMNRDIHENFGIQLNKDPAETTGVTLQKPILKFRASIFEPVQDYWESGVFYQAANLADNWCVVNTVLIDSQLEDLFFREFSNYTKRFGFILGKPHYIYKSKEELMEEQDSLATIVETCQRHTNGNLRFIMFVIDTSSTPLNRLIHLSFDEHPTVTATCLRETSITNRQQHRYIYRTLVHKLNARLGGTNVIYHDQSLKNLNLTQDDLLIIGLDVTHPDNELTGVSIVGCAYTFGPDLFRHRSLVWPQTARMEIIGKMRALVERILQEYYNENRGRLPKQIIIYRDGVSHEEFDRVRTIEISRAQQVLIETARKTNLQRPNLSYIIAQKRHTMRFFEMTSNSMFSNPPSGTLIDRDVVPQKSEFYLYSNTNPTATARPLHYHVLLGGLSIETLQKLTYYLCFNFGKCSGTLSMPSSLKYAHNAAYDARNRVIADREFSENKFYISKFFC